MSTHSEIPAGIALFVNQPAEGGPGLDGEQLVELTSDEWTRARSRSS